MNKNVKHTWLKALRSKKYKRAKQQLKVGDKYCCLGVLCDIYIKSKEGKANNARWEGNIFQSDETAFGITSVLPQEVVDWAELPDSNPDLGERTCSSVNDGDGKLKPRSFSEIADKIEIYEPSWS